MNERGRWCLAVKLKFVGFEGLKTREQEGLSA